MQPDDSEGRKRGRPRKNGTVSSDQRGDIIGTAIRLFSEKGYQRTSMSEIARLSGMSQSSLYYWYQNKAAILQDILEQNHTSSRLAATLSHTPGSIPAHLYAVLYSDVLMLCALPFDYYDLENVASRHVEDFSDFFETYDRLLEDVGRIIESGIANGDFDTDGAGDAAFMALTLHEGIQHRFHHGNQPDEGCASADMRRCAELAATMTIRALMRDPDIDTIREEAGELIRRRSRM